MERKEEGKAKSDTMNQSINQSILFEEQTKNNPGVGNDHYLFSMCKKTWMEKKKKNRCCWILTVNGKMKL